MQEPRKNTRAANRRRSLALQAVGIAAALFCVLAASTVQAATPPKFGAADPRVSMSLSTVAVAPVANASWVNPYLVRSIGGRGEPGVYAWGITYNPVSNEVLVGDYLNYEIRRYDLNGKLLGSFYRANNVGQPYSLAVDPRNGDIYVPELRDGGPSGYIAKYDMTGTFIKEIHTGARYGVWIAVDNQGYLYVLDSHYWNNAHNPPKIRKFDSDGNPITSWGTYGTGPGQLGLCYGIGIDANNNVYVTDSLSKRIHMFTSNGTWVKDFGDGYFTGDLRGLAVDQTQSLIYVNDVDNSQIEEFSIPDGTHLKTWGSSGSGPGQFAGGGRQLTVTPDGSVWDADYGNWRFQRFTPNGTLLGIYPDPAQPAPVGLLSQPRGVAVDSATGNVYVTDTRNERFQEYAPDGSLIGSWGARSSAPPYGFDYPRGIGFDNNLGRVWVINTRAHDIRRYNADASYIDTLGAEANDSSSPGYFRWPVYVDFFGGYAYVGDYNSGRVKQLDANTGQELASKSMNNNGVAVDPSTGNVYVVSWATRNVTVLSPDLQSIIRTFGSRGSGDGQFQTPWGITILNGVVYVTDVQQSRLQAFDLNGNFLGKWGGFGTGPYNFANPSGITHDAAGNLYIADSGNDRIQVYATTSVKPTGDNRKPTVTITAPQGGATLPGGTIDINGSATDAAPFGVAKVDVAVQDTDTGLWWNAKSATWVLTRTYNQAAAAGASITKMTYTFPFVGAVYSAHYVAYARATDVSSIVSPTIPSVSFATAASPGDLLTPQSFISGPTVDATVPGPVVTIAGNAGDNVGVDSVEISILDRTTQLWFDPVAVAWVGERIWFPATLASPDALETDWSYDFDHVGSRGSGSYLVNSRALDAAGNVETDAPFTRFIVES